MTLNPRWQTRRRQLRVRLRLAQGEHLVAVLPLAALLEHLHALETLEDIALCRDGCGTFETAMLGHVKGSGVWKKGRETIAAIPLRQADFSGE